jgi:glycosyltransferase involved in cell wall biosynthesis
MVGGNAPQLAKAERELGLRSWALSFEQEAPGYVADEVLFAPGDSTPRREWKRWRLLARAFRDFDVIHFNWGSSIMPLEVVPGSRAAHLYNAYARVVSMRDLGWLKRAGKGVVVTYQGGDARQADVAARDLGTGCALVGEHYPSDNAKRRRIRRAGRAADRIYALNPDLLRVLPARAEFMPYGHIDLEDWFPIPHPRNDVPVIAHAPSHRGIKGTGYLLTAVEALQHDGLALELDLIEGVTREEARRRYERADLLVDQLVTGWYGGLATELMALGRPVVAHIRQDDLRFVPSALAADLPVIDATQETIGSVLRKLVGEQKEDLPAIGDASRKFVERWHDPRRIAAGLADVYAEITRH